MYQTSFRDFCYEDRIALRWFSFLLNRDEEYWYLTYENNKFKRLVDALQYEDDLTKEIERAREQPIQETNNKLGVQNDGSIF
jgi:hypothetical protein